MKYIFTFFITAFAFNAFAGLVTVSNSSAYPAMFNTIQGGVNAAAVGDTVYVYHTGVFYNENVIIGKRIVLIGGGAYSDRVSKAPTQVNYIQLANSNASGSVIMGFYISYQVMVGENSQANNVLISDCIFGPTGDSNNPMLYVIGGSNIIIENNIFHGGLIVTNAPSINILIRNNVFYSVLGADPQSSGEIRNNLFLANDKSRLAFSPVQGGGSWGTRFIIENNIFYKRNPGGVTASSCLFRNNIRFDTNDDFPNGNPGNSNNITADPMFENYPAAGTTNFAINHNYKLKDASPGKNNGTDGKDRGAWGGQQPMNAFFEPPIPRVIELKLSETTVAPGGQVQLSIKATKAQ